MFAVGVDVGGTKIACGLVSRSGEVSNVVRVPTPAMEGGERVVDAIARLVGAQIGRVGVSSIVGIGVGSCGAIDANTGTVVASTDSMKNWVGTDIVSGIRSRLQLSENLLVRAQNDVTAHLEGEAWTGGAAGADSAVMFAVGTGVGGAVLLAGEIWRGAIQLGGDVAHIPIPLAEGLPCTCGGVGHLESVAAGPAIARHYLRLGGSVPVRDTREVFSLAGRGDGVALSAIVLAGRGLAQAVAGAISLLNPASIVIGGGLLDADPIWWDSFVSACRDELRPVLKDTPLTKAKLGSAAALVGAGHSVWKELL